MLKAVVIGALVLLLVFVLLMALPAIHIDANEVISSNIYSYIRAALYFIPTGTAAAILALVLAFWIWRVILALVKILGNFVGFIK